MDLLRVLYMCPLSVKHVSRSLAISARRTTTGPVETHRGGRRQSPPVKRHRGDPGHTSNTFRQRNLLASCGLRKSSRSPRVGHGGQVVLEVLVPLVGTGASHVNYRHGADRCSVAHGVAGTGVGSGSLIILAGVLVHRATRPQRQRPSGHCVSCNSGWSVHLVCRFN